MVARRVAQLAVELDSEKLYEAIVAGAAARGVSLRQVSRDTKVHRSTFTWLRQGRGLDADTFLALLKWVGEAEGTGMAQPMRFARKGRKGRPPRGDRPKPAATVAA